MSVDANALERETLERKDRDELQKIAGALGGKVTSRTRKADIIDMILEITGVTSPKAAEPEAQEPATEPQPEAPARERGAARQQDAGESRPAQGRQGQGQGQRPPRDRGEQPARPEPARAERPERQERQERPERDRDDASTDDDDRNGDAPQSGDQGDDDGPGGRRRRRRGRNRDATGPQDEYTGEPIPVVGVLDLRDDGYGFLRVDGLLPSKDDCYVSVKQVRQFGLRKGDVVAGGSRPAFRNEKNPAMLRIDTVNDVDLEPGAERPLFEDLAATFPTEQIELVVADGTDVDADDRITRALDLLAPIGKGSRVLLAGAPRTGRTTVLQTLVRAIEANQPDLRLLVVLLDERPEEITEMESLVAAGVVHGSAFDASPDDHVAVLELALARARRLAEAGEDVVVLVDGLTRAARAEHAAGPGSGRAVGGLDTAALHAAKRAFGAGRNLVDAGSVTLIATATVDSGSPADDAVYEAVAPAATTEIRLDRFAAERRAFPALDVGRTGTRREEYLVGDDGSTRREGLRRTLAALPLPDSADHADALDGLLDRLRDTKSNDELLDS